MAVHHLIMPPIRVVDMDHTDHEAGNKAQKQGPSQRLQGLAERIGPLPAVFCADHRLHCHLLTSQYFATLTKGLIPNSGLKIGVPHQTFAQLSQVT